MNIQLPDLSNTINSKLVNKSPAPPSNRRQKRNVNPPRRLEDYHLGAVGENCNVVSSNSNYYSDNDLTIGYSYPDYGPTAFSAPPQVISATATAFLPQTMALVSACTTSTVTPASTRAVAAHNTAAHVLSPYPAFAQVTDAFSFCPALSRRQQRLPTRRFFKPPLLLPPSSPVPTRRQRHPTSVQ